MVFIVDQGNVTGAGQIEAVNNPPNPPPMIRTFEFVAVISRPDDPLFERQILSDKVYRRTANDFGGLTPKPS